MDRKEREDSVKIQSTKTKQKSGFSVSAKIYKIFSSIVKVIWWSKSREISEVLDSWDILLLKEQLRKFIDILDIEDIELKQKIQYFVNEIFQTEDISEDILYIITIMTDTFGKEFVNENMDSFAHVLESVFTCSRMPELYDIKEYLDKTFPGVNQTEFMILITLFHDLKKTYKPSQYLEPVDAIKWWHLSSHQWDGAKFLLEWIEDSQSNIYNYFSKFLSKKNIDLSKISELWQLIARVIQWHAGNTEFIQIDTARTLLNIINYIDTDFANIDNFTKLKNRAVSFLEKLINQKIISYSELDFLKNLKESNYIIMYLKKLLIQKYIHWNIGRNIWLVEIELDKVKQLCEHMDKHMNKESSLAKLLEDSSNSYMLEDIIEEKKELWEKLDKDINKYLHPTFVKDDIENKMRLLFNINDIQSYIVPSSASFRKLLQHNSIDRLLTSPINWAVDVLAQLQLGIERSDSTMEKGFYQAMYYNGIANLKDLINAYHKKLKLLLPNNVPERIKEMGVTCEEAYIKACNTNYQTPEELKTVKDFFILKIDELCSNLETNIVYPSIKLEWHTLLCDGLWDLAYTETLDVFSKILVDESIDTIKIASNMTTNQKRILYNMLTNNYPLLEMLRLTNNSQIVNIRFSWLENITYELSMDFVYNILDSIKNLLILRFDSFYKMENMKGRVVRNHYKNITFSMPWWEPLAVLFTEDIDKKTIIKKAIEEKKLYIEEYALKLWKSKEYIINVILRNLSFGIWNSYLWESSKESEKIDAFYKADIMSRQNKNNSNLELSIFSEWFVKKLVEKAKFMEQKLINKYKDSECSINNIKHKVVVHNNWVQVINPILFRYIRKYSSNHKYSHIEIMNDISIYIDLLDSCFEFMSFFVRKKSPFQEVSDINDEFAKWLIKTKNITQNHKWTYSRQSLLELTATKGWLRMVININGMTVDNIDLFKKFSEKILDETFENTEFLIIWHNITVKFIEAVDLIKEKYPEAIISIWWYEKYVYIPDIENMNDFIFFVSKALDSKKLRAKLSYNYCENVVNSKDYYDRLLDSNKLVSYIEQFMEESIYELWFQDKIKTPNNISLYVWNKEIYFLDEEIIRKNLGPIIKNIIILLSSWDQLIEQKNIIQIWDSKLDIKVCYENDNMNIKIENTLDLS